MEILSIGEKIKRSRIYKGITLKDLCEDKISMSKMSSIENNKIKPDEDILKFVAEKLDLRLEYLKQDVREQITTNMSSVGNYKGEELEQYLKFNLEHSTRYCYTDLSLKIIHRLFNYYLETGKYNEVETLIPNYYELYQENVDVEKVYYKDMAMYFFKAEEYLEAITYFDKLCKSADEYNLDDNNIGQNYLYESICYSNLSLFDKASYYINESLNNVEKITDNKIKGEIMTQYLCLELKTSNKFDEQIFRQACECLEEYKDILSESYLRIAKIFSDKGNNEKFNEFMNKSLEARGSSKSYEYANYLIRCLEVLISCGEINKAESISDETLNLAIYFNDVKLIDKAYYYKAQICGCKQEERQMEMYMNLSMDALMKFGTPKRRYKRYMEMGYMYYELQDLQESLKYFSLANRIKNKL